MARNPLCHSMYNFKSVKKESIAFEFTSLIVAVFEGILWNTLDEFPRYLLLNLR